MADEREGETVCFKSYLRYETLPLDEVMGQANICKGWKRICSVQDLGRERLVQIPVDLR